MARLSRADMQAVLALAAEAGAAVLEPDRADQWLMERTCRLVDAEAAGYCQFNASGVLELDAEYPGPPFIPTEEEWELFRTQNPYSDFAVRTHNPFLSAHRLSDVVDMRAFRRTELYELVGAKMPHGIQMRMPGDAGSRFLFEVDRSGRNFGPREVLILDLLRPFLMAYESVRALSMKVEAIRSAPSSSEAALTPREREILDLVASGAKNAAIAEKLWISPWTVKKHLENIYAKLEVGSRTAALARTGRSSVEGDRYTET